MVRIAAQFVTDPDNEVRSRAFELLRDHGNRAYLAVAVSGLADSETVVVATAIECIVEWDARRAADRVARLLESSDELVRFYAAWGLGRVGGRRHVAPLRRRFRVARSEVEGSSVAEALYRLTGRREYLRHLLTQLKSPDPEVRACTTNSLAGVVDERNFDEIICALVHALAKERNRVVVVSLRRDLELAVANALDAVE